MRWRGSKNSGRPSTSPGCEDAATALSAIIVYVSSTSEDLARIPAVIAVLNSSALADPIARG